MTMLIIMIHDNRADHESCEYCDGHGDLDGHDVQEDHAGDGDDDDDVEAPVEKDSLGEDFLHSMSRFCVVLLRSVRFP